jgi:hypothetical protein
MSSGRPRALAALLGLLAIVLGTVGVAHHNAVETHVRCEHGDLVHVERVAETEPAETADGVASFKSPIRLDTEDHHHCCSAVQLTAAAPTSQILSAPAVAAAKQVPGIVSRVEITAALYRLAPKTSPPIVAV